MYRVTIDREACEGIFACLVRDDRFVEDDDGLAALERATPAGSRNGGGETAETDDGVVHAATFDDDAREAAEQAAAACPVDAISVTDADETGAEP